MRLYDHDGDPISPTDVLDAEELAAYADHRAQQTYSRRRTSSSTDPETPQRMYEEFYDRMWGDA